MSANRWSVCPKCLAAAEREVGQQREAVAALYGKVPVEEFDAKRAALPTVKPGDFCTFREDFEVGADDGVVEVDYSGECAACGLSVTLKTDKQFWPAEVTA